MIVGAFIVNKSQVISRFTDPLLVSKIELLILDFMQDPKPLVFRDLYKYISIITNGVYYVLVTSLQYREVKGRRILSFISNNSTLDPLDQLVTIDNILYNGNPVFPNLSLIKNMESQEEKIYNMMMKSKESEMKKKYNKINKDSTYKKDNMHKNSLDNMHKNSLDNMHKNSVDNMHKDNNKDTIRLRSFETSKKGIFILIKEKMKCQVDVENNIKFAEINGEMILNIKKEEYKNIQISIKGDTSKCKFSPKLDKEAYKNNIIRSNKDFSINKNIALMKWKNQSIKNIPITFTFWPSEVKLGVYQVSLEFTGEEDLSNLVINIPKKNMVDSIGSNEYIEWNIGNIKKGDSDTLDFQCKCNDILDIFPIEVHFTSEKLDIKIEDIKIEDNIIEDNIIEDDVEDYEVRKIMEVEEFKLEYE